MTTPRPRSATHDASDSAIDRVDRATSDLVDAVRAMLASRPDGSADPAASRRRPRLAAGGLVLVTDDGRGIARAVAADLRALGYAVARVRHGVGEGDVEGLNLTAAAAVAALVDRLRARGPIAAVVHLAPLRARMEAQAAWDAPDDARSLALLAQASADDLLASAALGGSCLVVAHTGDSADSDDRGRLSRWIEILVRTLKGVRVRGLEFDGRREPEVVAAEVVRATLGTDEPAAIAGDRREDRPPSFAILLGAPDRASWIHLAAALADWLDDAPSVRMADLAYTLHRDQPRYPFRVGSVARTGSELAARLRRAIAELASPARGSIHDLGGTYCVDPAARGNAANRRAAAHPWSGRLRGLGAESPDPPRPAGPDLEALARWSGRDWSNHLIALRFARDGSPRADSLREEGARLLDLSVPPGPSWGARESDEAGGSAGSRALGAALGALDEAIAARSEVVFALLEGEGAD